MTVPQQGEAPRKGEGEEQEGQVTSIPGLPTPPDGGWGWVVVFASFMIHVIADGFTYTFGILYVQLLNYYRNSKSTTSWIASILVGVTLGSGPISGMLVNKFGCRLVTIVGAVLASLCLFLSVYASTIVMLYVTIGLGCGLGFGLIYLPAIVCVTGYFEKRRSFATGIAVCGSGIGTFIFSPLFQGLIDEYSWKGSLIVLSGIVLNCVFFGSLFRPVEDNLPPATSKVYEVERTPEENFTLKPLMSEATELKKIQSDADLELKARKNDIQRYNSHNLLHNSYHNEVKQMTVSQPLLPVPESNGPHRLVPSKSGSLPPSHHGSGLLYRKDIFYRGSLCNIPAYKENPSSYRNSMVILPDTEKTPSEIERTKVCGCVPCSRETRDALGNLMDWSLLTDGIYILFVVSNFCTSIGFNAPYIYIVDRALHQGITTDRASFLLAVVGIANTISRVLLGYIADQPWVNRLYLYNISLTICGLGTCLSIFGSDYISHCIYAAVFGATSGAYVGLTSVVLVDLLGMEKLTNAFGLLLMFQGIASLIGPPMCGALYDMTGVYDYSFLLAGSMIAFSGLMLFFIPCIWKEQARKLAKENSVARV
ncbi:monocarboxylate transporter 1 isoform X2 [Oratosquilla oratoria]|uniref:monocarboxylate transporter 1 isoform X2 n=1 Tax=Oratosquilla oratoria TaxID=337810 RepID=UPI003F76180D